MARIRSIKPEFWTSEQVMELSRDARVIFIGMWNFCDDGGNHPASPKTLKAEVCPGDEDVAASDIMRWVDELIEQGLVEEYEATGKEFWHVTGWRHQRIDSPTLRHPSGDTRDRGDAGDAGDAGDTSDARHPKRLGGKQRQLLMKKLRDKEGDACHLCGSASSLTVVQVTNAPDSEPNGINGYRLICSSCKRKFLSGMLNLTQRDSAVTRGDADGDSPTESKGVESNGVELSKQTGEIVVGGKPTRGDTDDFAPKDAAEWQRYFRDKHGVELDHRNTHHRQKAWPLFAAWTNAGITSRQMDAAVAKAQAEAEEPIAFLPAYVDRVLASQGAARNGPGPNKQEQLEARNRAVAQQLAEDHANANR